jgi:dimethylargininase
MLAITRAVSPSLGRCELTHLERSPIDVDLARAQHRAYEEALASLGARVVPLPEEPDLPDAVFVEDTAVVTPELAVLTRPGAASRRPEVVSVARALAPHRRLAHLEAPATLDGGDVLQLGRTFFVGRSGRTGEEGIGRLRDLFSPFGYAVEGVPITGCLHLKSAVTCVADGVVLVNPAWVDPRVFGARWIEVDPAEPAAANALRIGGAVIHAARHGRTRARLEREGFRVVPVDVSELEKAEGAVTCCSVLVDD